MHIQQTTIHFAVLHSTFGTNLLFSFVSPHIPDESPSPSHYVISSFSPSPVLLSITPSLFIHNSKRTCFKNLFRGGGGKPLFRQSLFRTTQIALDTRSSTVSVGIAFFTVDSDTQLVTSPYKGDTISMSTTVNTTIIGNDIGSSHCYFNGIRSSGPNSVAPSTFIITVPWYGHQCRYTTWSYILHANPDVKEA